MEYPVALITGCSKGGIGFAFCENLAARGYIVYATSRSLTSMDDLRHPNIRKHVCDVTKDQQVESVVSKIMVEEKRVDLLINNAGIPGVGAVIDWTVDEAKVVFDTNVFSILRFCRAVIPHMAKRKQGTILNIGSLAGELSPPWLGIYSATKSSVSTISEVLSLECRPFNISVTYVNTGTVRTSILNKTDSYTAPSTSLYHSFVHNIQKCMDMGRGEGNSLATDVDVYVERVLNKTIGRSGTVRRRMAPVEVLEGSHTWSHLVMRLLPKAWYLELIWSLLGKPLGKGKAL